MGTVSFGEVRLFAEARFLVTEIETLVTVGEGVEATLSLLVLLRRDTICRVNGDGNVNLRAAVDVVVGKEDNVVMGSDFSLVTGVLVFVAGVTGLRGLLRVFSVGSIFARRACKA